MSAARGPRTRAASGPARADANANRRRDGNTTAIDADLVRRLVGEQLPKYRELPVTPVVPSGHDNRTFRVGGSLCARLPSASRYAPGLLTEHAWLPRLTGRLPLPIPQPVALGTPGAGYRRNRSIA